MITVYTDGGCSGNPGPGAWSFVAIGGGVDRRRSGYERQTTNNRMEIQAVIEALREVVVADMKAQPVAVHTDSRYVQQGITQWVSRWVRNGWQTSGKAPVKNAEQWRALLDLTSGRPVEFHWVRGHAKVAFNEECHRMVKERSRAG